MDEIMELIKRLVKENADVQEVGDDSSFMDDLEMASIEIFAFIGDLEDELSIRIPNSVLNSASTVRELAEEIMHLI